MALSSQLVKEFVSATYDETNTKTNNSYYATAVINGEGEFVRLDGSDIDTPATFTVKAHDGDRVLVILQNRKVIVTGNITSPSLLLGVLEANDHILVRGYLTTNEERTSYNDDRALGLTFSSGGIGAKGTTSKWYMTADGSLYANDAEIIGKVTAGSGKIGDFTIGSMLYYGSKNSFDSSAAGLFFGKDGIALGENSPFKVTAAGALTATSATIIGSITANSGYLGSKANGFNIDEWGIFSGAKGENSNGYITLTTKDFSRTINNEALSGLRFAIGSKFAVDASGVLHAADGIFSGTIKSSAGNIGDFTIGNALYTNKKASIDHANAGVYIGSDGVALGAPGKFKVTSDGLLNATGATISGAITATSLTLSGNGINKLGTLPADGATSAGNNTGFKVSSAGLLTAANAVIYGTIYATDGKFTGDIVANSLTLGKDVSIDYSKIASKPDLTVYISKDGTLGTLPAGEADSANKTGFKVSSQGLLTASNAVIYGTIYAKSGKFTGDIYANSLTLGPNATIPYDSVEDTPDLTVYIMQDGTLGTLPSEGATTSATVGFKVSSKGALVASNAIIYGTIYATNGQFTGSVTATSLTLDAGVKIDYEKNLKNTPDLTDVVRDTDLDKYIDDDAMAAILTGDTKVEDLIPAGKEAVFIMTDGKLGSLPDPNATTAGGHTGFLVDKNGLLKASNAVIYGTIYASAGKFTGDIVANSLTLNTTIPSSKITGLDDVVRDSDISDVVRTSNLTSYFTKDDIKSIISGDTDLDTLVPSGKTAVFVRKNKSIGATPSDSSNTGFLVDNDGLLKAKNAIIWGTIYSSAGKIGGLAIDSSSIHTDGVAITSSADNSIGLSSVNFTRTIKDSDGTNVSRSGLRFAIGGNFAIDYKGRIYGTSATLDTNTIACSKEIVMYNTDIQGNTGYLKARINYTQSGDMGYGSSDPTVTPGSFKLTSNVAVTAPAIDCTGRLVVGGNLGVHSQLRVDGIIDSYSNIYSEGTLISLGKTGFGASSSLTRFRLMNSMHDMTFRVTSTGAAGLYSETNSEWLIYTKANETVGNWAYIPMSIDAGSVIRAVGTISSYNTSVSSTLGFYTRNSKAYYGMLVNSSGSFVLWDQDNSKSIMTYYPSTAKVWDTGYVEINRVLLVAGPDSGDKGPRMALSASITAKRRINYLATAGNSDTASHQTWLNVRGQFNNSNSYVTQSYASASSDIRLKTNVRDTRISDALSLIRQIKMREFDWKDMDHEGGIRDHQKIGFIADELEELDDRLAAGGGYDEDGSMNIKSVDTFYLLGYVVKALQELDNRLNALQKGAN